jgi:hypothetical protein
MEGEQSDTVLPEPGNRWYFFVPLVLVGIWLIQAIGWLVLSLIAPDAEARVRQVAEADPTSGLGVIFELVAWMGVVGWLALFIFYFTLVSRKGLSGWWALGGVCVGLNLPLYVLLLFQRSRWYRPTPLAPLRSAPPGPEQSDSDAANDGRRSPP